MKNFNQKMFFSFLLVSSTFFLSSYNMENFSDNNINQFKMADNTCTLYVKTSYGSPAKSIKVTTEVSGGILCIGGRSFYTDNNGEVTLKWVSGCYLRKIYVDGKGYDVDYKDREKYYLTMR